MRVNYAALAEIAYHEYGKSCQWVSVNGTTLPVWQHVKTDVKAHWVAAVMGVVNALGLKVDNA